jgi:GNAT superfamily N-acetyltransferase
VTRGNAGELISAFVSPRERGFGIGRLLVASLEEEAKNRKFEDILVLSGSRFRETGWPFWQSLYGEPVEVYDRSAIWHKQLTDKKRST